jgi:hypothetical protein
MIFLRRGPWWRNARHSLVVPAGTSLGVGSMKPGSTVAVSIDGIDTLVNRFE